MLVEAAWAAARGPGPLRAFFQRVRARRGQHVAAVATARKLACRLIIIGAVPVSLGARAPDSLGGTRGPDSDHASAHTGISGSGLFNGWRSTPHETCNEPADAQRTGSWQVRQPVLWCTSRKSINRHNQEWDVERDISMDRATAPSTSHLFQVT